MPYSSITEMRIKPISLKDANMFVHKYHKHHKPVVGHKFSICIKVGEEIKGVAICGRPVAPKTCQETILEVARNCVNELPNGCSKLYGACARIAKEMGYDKIQTFILQRETGISLRASGWFCEDDNAGGKEWNSSKGRIRVNTTTDLFGTTTKYPSEKKQRWVKILNHGF